MVNSEYSCQYIMIVYQRQQNTHYPKGGRFVRNGFNKIESATFLLAKVFKNGFEPSRSN